MEKWIHLVWVGHKPIDAEIVSDWQKGNPDSQVFIWIDKQTMPKAVHDIYQARGYAPVDEGQGEPPLKRARVDKPPPQLADITEMEVSSEYIRYELDRFQPNYGAASDMIRNKVLKRYGGFYIDIDIKPGRHSLSKAQLWEGEEIFKITNYSQNRPQVSNDAKLSSKGHVLITAIDEQAEKNYSDLENWLDPKQYDDTGFRKDATIERTGPECDRAVLGQCGALEERHSEEDAPCLTKPEFCLPRAVYTPDVDNAASWTKSYIRPSYNFQACMDTAMKSLKFEVTKLFMFRFSAHAEDMYQSLLEPLKDELKRIATEIFKRYYSKENWQSFIARQEIRLTKKLAADFGLNLKEEDCRGARENLNFTYQERQKLVLLDKVVAALSDNVHPIDPDVFHDALFFELKLGLQNNSVVKMPEFSDDLKAICVRPGSGMAPAIIEKIIDGEVEKMQAQIDKEENTKYQEFINRLANNVISNLRKGKALGVNFPTNALNQDALAQLETNLKTLDENFTLNPKELSALFSSREVEFTANIKSLLQEEIIIECKDNSDFSSEFSNKPDETRLKMIDTDKVVYTFIHETIPQCQGACRL